MLAASPDTGEVRRFLTGPRGCEITGVIMTPDQCTMFINVQHPGESTTYWNNLFGPPSTANPTAVSSWPLECQFSPRPAVPSRAGATTLAKDKGMPSTLAHAHSFCERHG
jgi:secreted PhoX family phosphatase